MANNFKRAHNCTNTIFRDGLQSSTGYTHKDKSVARCYNTEAAYGKENTFGSLGEAHKVLRHKIHMDLPCNIIFLDAESGELPLRKQSEILEASINYQDLKRL